MAVGVRTNLLLSQNKYSLLDAFPEDDLFSAISHELAHVLRCDFLFNLLYQIASLPVRFTLRGADSSRIAQTRELACDEIAAQMLPTAKRYDTRAFTGARSNYALGLFDTNTLEERIMNILKNNDTSKKTGRKIDHRLSDRSGALIGLFVAAQQRESRSWRRLPERGRQNTKGQRSSRCTLRSRNGGVGHAFSASGGQY